MIRMRMLGWTAAAVLGLHVIHPAGAAVVFQADFNGAGAGTGGVADIVTLGGAGQLLDTTRTSVQTTGAFVTGSGGFFHAATGGIGRVKLTPTAAASSLDAMTSVVAGDRVLNGGLDFFFRTDAAFTNHNQFRPIDVDNRSNGGLRLILSNVYDGATKPTAPDRISLEILSNATGLRNTDDDSASLTSSVNFSGNTKILANTVYHVGLSFASDANGTVTMKLWLQEGTGSIDLSGTPFASKTFGVNEAVTTAGFAPGFFNLANNLGATAQDFDTFRVHSGTLTEFAGIVVPEPASLALLGLGGLAMASSRRR